LTNYKMFGTNVPYVTAVVLKESDDTHWSHRTYESASTKQFLHGRTETVRCCSDASVAFVKSTTLPIICEKIGNTVSHNSIIVNKTNTTTNQTFSFPSWKFHDTKCPSFSVLAWQSIDTDAWGYSTACKLHERC
jgi:hypothetical protein